MLSREFGYEDVSDVPALLHHVAVAIDECSAEGRVGFYCSGERVAEAVEVGVGL